MIASPSIGAAPRVPALTWVNVFTRLLAIQGSWNYETLIGNGVGFVSGGEDSTRRVVGRDDQQSTIGSKKLAMRALAEGIDERIGLCRPRIE